MKKLLLLLMALILAFSLIACDEGKTTDDDDEDEEEEETTVTTDSGGATGGSNGENNGETDPSTGNSEQDPENPGSTEESGSTSSSTGDNTDPSKGEVEKDPQNPGSTEQTSSSSGQGQGDPFDPGENKPSVPSGAGLALSNAIIKQLENAESMRLEFSLDLLLDANGWVTDEYGAPVSENDWGHGIANFVVIICKGNEGYNLMVEADVKSKTDKNGDYKTDLSGAILYIVDGVMYEYDEDYEAYIATELEEIDMSELDQAFDAIMGEIEISEEEMNAVLDTLGAMFIETFGIKDGLGSATVDFKAQYDAVVEYIDSIDLTRDTLRDLLNEALEKSDAGVTVKDIMDSVYAAMKMTVGEYITQCEQSLGMTFQEFYNSIVSDPQFQTLLATILSSEGATAEEIAQMMAQLQALDLETLFTPEALGLTMYDYMVATMTEESGEEYPTAEELMTYIDSVLDMPLQSLEAQLDIPFSALKMFPSLITLREFNSTVEIKLKNLLSIDEIKGSGKLDITVTMPSEVDGKLDIVTVVADISVKLHSISSEPGIIEIPSNVIELPLMYRQTYTYEVSESGVDMVYELSFSNLTEKTVDVRLDVTIKVSGYGSVTTRYEGTTELKYIIQNLVVIPGNVLEGDGGEVITEDVGFTLDIENGTFTIVQ